MRKLRPTEEARRLAAAMMAAEDDGWSYLVVPDPERPEFAAIEVRDEEFNLVAWI